MLRASVFFFILGLLSMSLGIGNLAGVSFELGRLLLFLFLALSIVFFAGSLVTGRRLQPPA
jgi:uncharacterized membrane protein YtjA (UPF0391 family)